MMMVRVVVVVDVCMCDYEGDVGHQYFLFFAFVADSGSLGFTSGLLVTCDYVSHVCM